MIYIDDVIKEYGITYNPYEAGYVLSDGRMLDFSEKRNGGPGGSRSLDHRDVAGYYPDALNQTDGMNKFMEDTHAVRIAVLRDYIGLDYYAGVGFNECQTARICKLLVRRDKVLFMDIYNDVYDCTPIGTITIEACSVGAFMQALESVKKEEVSND